MNDNWFFRLAAVATLLVFVIVMSGAWVRLSDAGLGCPDWPGCYGRLTPPVSGADLAAANVAFPERPVELTKAWREMIHRYIVPVLGLFVLALAAIAWRRRHDPLQPVLAPLLLIPLLGFQAWLGMLTVTLKLHPAIVMGHLLGGMTTLGLLGWITLRSRPRPPRTLTARPRLRALAVTALVVVTAQIALGGWTSANYAALACVDFPTCQGQWWPPTDFAAAFALPDLGRDYQGGVLDSPARTAVHLVHRLGALITALVVGAIALFALVRGRDHATRGAAAWIALALVAQIALGVAMIARGLPLTLAVAHNGTAALLLLGVVALNYAAWRAA